MNLSINRIVTAVLIAVLLLLQFQIWTGRGSVQEVSLMKLQLESQRNTNAQLEQQIGRIESEISDLKKGLSTVEEKARYEMGMLKPNEIFVQIAR